MNKFSFWVFSFLLLFLFGCKTPDKGYDLYIYNNENTAQFDAVCKAYTAETGIRVKIGFPGQGRDYKNELKAELNSKSRPVVFYVRNIDEVKALREEGFIQDLSHAGDGVFAGLVAGIPLPLRLGVEGSYGIPSELGAYGYMVDRRMISALFGAGNEDAALAAIKTASYEEWAALIQVIDRWMKYAFPYRVFLSGRLFLLTSVKPAQAENLNGVFALGGGTAEQDGGVKQVYGNHLANAALNAAAASNNETIKLSSRHALIDFARALDMETSFPAGADGQVQRVSFPAGGFDQALQIFFRGKAVFLGADSRIYKQLAATDASITASFLEFLPVKIPFRNAVLYGGISYGKTAEINRSLPVYAVSFLAVNALASVEEKKKAYDFLVWLTTTGRGYYNDNPAFVPYYAEPANAGAIPNSLFNSIIGYMKTGDIIASPLPPAFGVSLGKKLEEEFFKKPFWTEADYEAIADYVINELLNKQP